MIYLYSFLQGLFFAGISSGQLRVESEKDFFVTLFINGALVVLLMNSVHKDAESKTYE